MNILGEFIKYTSLILVVILLVSLLVLTLKEFGLIKVLPLKKIYFFKCDESFLMKNEKEKNNLKLFRDIFIIVISSRLLLLLCVTITYRFIRNDFRSLIEVFQYAFNRWDSPHYLDIAKNFYQNSGDEKLFIVFFPLYPILVKLVQLVVKNYFFAAIIVSNLSLTFAVFYFYKLLNFDFNNKIKKLSIVFLLIAPFSFFLSGIYTESLFLALSVACFYYIREQKWLLAAVLGYLAALTRNVGVLLVIPYLIEGILADNPFVRSRKFNFNILKERIKKALYMMIIPMGTITYLIINKVVTGDYFTFMKYQKEHWFQQFGFFANNIKMHFLYIFSYDKSISLTTWLPQTIIFFIAIFATYYTFNKIKASYSLYALACLLIAYSPTWLLSGARYTLVVFPIYISLAMFAEKTKLKYIFIVLSGILLFVYTLAFELGYHVV